MALFAMACLLRWQVDEGLVSVDGLGEYYVCFIDSSADRVGGFLDLQGLLARSKTKSESVVCCIPII